MTPSAQSGLTRLKAMGVVASSRELSVFTPRLIARHQSFDPLTIAISQRQRVSFSYRKADAEASVRLIDPQKLRFIEGQWVLLGLEGSELKNFLLRRIVSEVKMLGQEAALASPLLISEAEAELGKFIDQQLAIISLKPESEAWWHFGAPAESKITLQFMDEALLAEDLLEFGTDLSVISPKSLATRIRRGLEKVVSDHA